MVAVAIPSFKHGFIKSKVPRFLGPLQISTIEKDADGLKGVQGLALNVVVPKKEGELNRASNTRRASV